MTTIDLPAMRAYWNQGVTHVPVQTGAAAVMDGSDAVAVWDALGLEPPFMDVLDVGCGTGRLSRFCESWMGVDVADDAVAYCKGIGLRASRIDGPVSIRNLDLGWVPTWIFCLSVFTHIDADERAAYLHVFAEMGAPHVLVDVIPGSGHGGVSLWTANVAQFRQQIAEAGFDIAGETPGLSGVNAAHHYFHLVRC